MDTIQRNQHLRITKDVYDKKHQEYQDKMQTLEIEFSEHRKADYNYQTTLATVISVARRAKTIFELHASEPDCKRKKAIFFNSFSVQFSTRTS